MDEKKEKGIQAIIFLQRMAGINETREQAEKGWDRMSEYDRENTLAAYTILGPHDN